MPPKKPQPIVLLTRTGTDDDPPHPGPRKTKNPSPTLTQRKLYRQGRQTYIFSDLTPERGGKSPKVRNYPKNAGQILHGDARKLIPQQGPKIADLVFLHPPLPGNKQHQVTMDTPMAHKLFQEVLDKSYLALKPFTGILTILAPDWVRDPKTHEPSQALPWEKLLTWMKERGFHLLEREIYITQDEPAKNLIRQDRLTPLSHGQHLEMHVWGNRIENTRKTHTTQRSQSSQSYIHRAPDIETITKKIIEDWTQPEDFVLDPFAGEGTTLQVCEKTCRGWIGIELHRDILRRARNSLAEVYQTNKHENHPS